MTQKKKPGRSRKPPGNSTRGKTASGETARAKSKAVSRAATNLGPEALAHLRSEGISKKTAEACGLYEIPGHFGGKPKIAFPYFDKNRRPIKTPDGNPFVRSRFLGETVDGRKYDQERGTPNHAYLPPTTDFRKPSSTEEVVEGEKEAIHLAVRGIRAIGIPGHSSWRDPDGELVENIRSLKVKGKDWIATPDNDLGINYQVSNGWHGFALKLLDEGAKSVGIRVIPPGDKCGAGDYIREHGKREYLKLPVVYPTREELEVYRNQHRTDVGNAHRLVQNIQGRCIYVPQFKKWAGFDGTRHVIDEDGRMIELAKATVRQMFQEAPNLSDDERNKLIKHAMLSEHIQRLRAMVELASTDSAVVVHQDQLDVDPNLLGVQNGVLDLKTQTLRPASPSDLISKQVHVAYDSKAKCPNLLSFLRYVTNGNKELMSYLQRAVGYTLSGETIEQCLFFIHGQGANGKSTFVNALYDLLGDYAISTTTTTFMVKGAFSAEQTNDIARLRGVRMVSAVETEGGARLAESRIKQLTGGDVVTARFLHQEFFDFRPICKVWMSGNYKPRILGTDDGIWRRIHLITFDRPIKRQDQRFSDKLQAELPGILNWALAGYAAWQRRGLKAPSVVTQAVEEYRSEQDVMGVWIENCCVEGRNFSATSAELFISYTKWQRTNNEREIGRILFGRLLSERFRKHPRPKPRAYIGVKVRERKF